MSLITDLTSPYSRLESAIYDRVIAPAVVGLLGSLEDTFVIEAEAGSMVLDVGCGGGQVLRALAEQHPLVRFSGVDLSAAQCERARRRVAHLDGQVGIFEGSAMELPFADETFDVVYTCASIKHWPNAFNGLSECLRVLRSGGRLLVVEAERGCSQADARAFVEQWRAPSILAPIHERLFRRFVAGRSLTLEDIRALARVLPLSDWEAIRIPGSPAFALSAGKV